MATAELFLFLDASIASWQLFLSAFSFSALSQVGMVAVALR
jgi:hypothetical protein